MVKYFECPRCGASFPTTQLVGSRLPSHRFLGKPCPGSGKECDDPDEMFDEFEDDRTEGKQ